MSGGPDFTPTAGFEALAAPAKINLFLHVVGQRPDGYHELQTAFQFIDFFDYLSFRLRQDGQIHVYMSQDSGIAREDNLIYRAARLLQQRQSVNLGADIYCDKHIPAGAGLGGGSSNAATTLIALNRLWGLGLVRAALMPIALELGADVPVFVFGQPAFAQGVGEQLSATAAIPAQVLLFTPDLFVSTKAVFSAPDLTRDTERVSIYDFTNWLKAYGSQNDCFGRNDLQKVAFKLHPELYRLHHYLNVHGVNAKLSGSGSSLFALFATACMSSRQPKEICDRMLSELINEVGIDVHMGFYHSLGAHPLKAWLD